MSELHQNKSEKKNELGTDKKEIRREWSTNELLITGSVFRILFLFIGRFQEWEETDLFPFMFTAAHQFLSIFSLARQDERSYNQKIANVQRGAPYISIRL